MTTLSSPFAVGHRSTVVIRLTLGAFLFGTLAAQAAAPWRARQVSARSMSNKFAEQPAAGALRPAERAFLNKAVENSRQQMRLAEVGVSHADNSDVRSHALQLVTDYRALHDALEAMVRRKGGIAGAPVGGTSQTYQKLAEKAGVAFDREFVRTVSQLSDDVLASFEQMVSESKDPDIRELAGAQLPVLRAHRNSIVELKKTLE